MNELARAEHDNLIETLGVIAAAQPDGLVDRSGGVAVLASGLSMRLFNQVLVESESASPAAIERAVALMRERRAPFTLCLRPGSDDRFRMIAEGVGLVFDPDNGLPGMAVAPLPDPQPAPAGLEIRGVNAATLADHASVVELGFGVDRAIVDAVVCEATVADPRFAYYVGYVDQLPVVAGLGVRTGQTMGVFNIATIEEARRRGYGAAITRRVLTDGARLGCTIGTLQASDLGRPVYEAIGFRTVVNYVWCVDPAPVATDNHG